MKSFAPPATPPAGLGAALRRDGYAVLASGDFARWLGAPAEQLDALHADWRDLPPDDHLRDGGRYRTRRHACFIADGERLEQVPRRAHWQPIEYNALHGGMRRWFAPMLPGSIAQPVWPRLLHALAGVASELRGAQPWFIEAHQFRIDTTGGIGRPTPEGAHRDGVELVAVMLIERQGIKGGESRVFEAEGRRGERFTLSEPWTLLLLDDARVIHESTPIQPLAEGRPGWRDTLVLTFSSGGFQGD